MARILRKSHLNARLDALIALPLSRFRNDLMRLSSDDLTMLQRRIDTRIVGARWARGGRGMVRHRALGELVLLSRREQATADEFKVRREVGPATVHLLHAQERLPAPVLEDSEALAA